MDISAELKTMIKIKQMSDTVPNSLIGKETPQFYVGYTQALSELMTWVDDQIKVKEALISEN
jgi:hypothetical protein